MKWVRMAIGEGMLGRRRRFPNSSSERKALQTSIFEILVGGRQNPRPVSGGFTAFFGAAWVFA